MSFGIKAVLICCLGFATARAELAVTVSSVKTTGRKAVLTLGLTNFFPEKIESARATVFLFDDAGKVTGQSTRWIIGGSPDIPGLNPNAGTQFHFVVEADKPFATNRVFVNRVVLSGGRVITPLPTSEPKRQFRP